MVFEGAPHDARRSAVALAAAVAATKAICGVSTAVAMDEPIRKALRAQWVFFPTRVARTAPPLVSVNHGSLRCRWADALATAAAIIKSSSSSSNSSWFNVFNIPLIFTLSRQNSFWCTQGLPGTARLTNFSALICTGSEEFSPCFSRTWRLQSEDPEIEPCPKMDLKLHHAASFHIKDTKLQKCSEPVCVTRNIPNIPHPTKVLHLTRHQLAQVAQSLVQGSSTLVENCPLWSLTMLTMRKQEMLNYLSICLSRSIYSNPNFKSMYVFIYTRALLWWLHTSPVSSKFAPLYSW